MRIDKYLANMNVGSRKEVHTLIKKGLVTLNQKVVTSPKTQVKDSDQVVFNGQKINYQKFHYFILNKPKGVLSATEDTKQKTVLDLLKKADRYQDLAPVGRLDKDTTGLLLITNDGQLNHELLAPKKHVAKLYWAKIAGICDEKTVNTFKNGIILKDGSQLKPAKLKILTTDLTQKTSEIEVEIVEGKYHQIKRMFASCQMKVLELKRLKMGNLTLPGDLKAGEYRKISIAEIK